MDHDELSSAKKYFDCYPNRASVPKDSLVIGRYSVLPFYKELEEDLAFNGSKLINSYQQHCYVADAINWIYDLGDLTPKTWTRLEDLPENMSFVLKGETNSRKHDWEDLMFAKDKRSAINIHSKLTQDGLIGYQQIYIREYIPLKTYMVGIKGLPITHEFRFFVCYGKIISGGYYWSSHVDDFDVVPDVSSVPKEFLDKVTSIIGNKINFYVLDVALTDSGEWIVIELNDGSMSGISENNSDTLYSNLKKVLDKHVD